MAHLEDRLAFDGHFERTRARMLKGEGQRLTQMSEKLKKREAKLGRARQGQGCHFRIGIRR